MQKYRERNLYHFHFVHNKLKWAGWGSNPGLGGERWATNRLSRGTAQQNRFSVMEFLSSTPCFTVNYFLGGKGCRRVGLTNLPISCTDFLEIWERQPLWTPRGLFSPVQRLIYFTLNTSISHYKDWLVVLCIFKPYETHIRLADKTLWVFERYACDPYSSYCAARSYL
jgi:hypothetical protein